ncbi:MAG: hypothetical protein HY430_03585 [Candidatus Levybacteria bacterium]|nr:hypothetical protein [Candidatus Levybacteria bacterium]
MSADTMEPIQADALAAYVGTTAEELHDHLRDKGRLPERAQRGVTKSIVSGAIPPGTRLINFVNELGTKAILDAAREGVYTEDPASLGPEETNAAESPPKQIDPAVFARRSARKTHNRLVGEGKLPKESDPDETDAIFFASLPEGARVPDFFDILADRAASEALANGALGNSPATATPIEGLPQVDRVPEGTFSSDSLPLSGDFVERTADSGDLILTGK